MLAFYITTVLSITIAVARIVTSENAIKIDNATEPMSRDWTVCDTKLSHKHMCWECAAELDQNRWAEVALRFSQQVWLFKKFLSIDHIILSEKWMVCCPSASLHKDWWKHSFLPRYSCCNLEHRRNNRLHVGNWSCHYLPVQRCPKKSSLQLRRLLYRIVFMLSRTVRPS